VSVRRAEARRQQGSIPLKFLEVPRRWRLWVLALLVALLTVDCGARTGPLEPCEIPLEKDRPVVMLLLEHGLGMSLPGRCNSGPFSSSRWDAIVESMNLALPALDDALVLGAYVYPVPGPDPMGLGVDYEYLCQVDPGAVVPARANNTTSVLAAINGAGRPAGSQPVYEALRLARRALDAPALNGRSKFIVIANFGASNCNGAISRAACDCPFEEWMCFADVRGRSYGCDDTARVVDLIGGFRRESIDTLVMGLSCPDPALARYIRNLDAMAIAGGRPRPDGPYRFYLSTDPEGFRTGLEEALLPLAYCRLQVRGDLRPGEDAVLVDDDDQQTRADPTRRDGWDWTDRAAGKLEVFGPACRSIAQRRRALRMLTTRSRCSP